MRPSQVLDLHADIIDRWDTTLFAQVVQNCFMIDLDVDEASVTKRDVIMIQQNATYLRRTVGNHIRAAYDYRVTEDMSLLIKHAADALNEEDTWDHSQAPTGTGLVRFDKPLELQDIRGRMLKIHWMTWGPALSESSTGQPVGITLMTFWNDSWDSDEVGDEYGREILGVDADVLTTVMGRWRWIGATYYQDGKSLGPQMMELDPDVARTQRLINEGVELTPHTNQGRYAYALWLMLNQTITQVEIEEPDRAGRRRAEKMKIPPRVTVIKLRRTKGVDRAEGESLVEWNRRWVVRGHWRWQHCGPHYLGAVEVDEGKYRCRIWIAPHIKGPDDKPLIGTEKVYSLER